MFDMQNRVRNGEQETVLTGSNHAVVVKLQPDGGIKVLVHKVSNKGEHLPNGYIFGSNALEMGPWKED